MASSTINPLLPLLLIGLCLLVTSLGFRNSAYFVSIGYAFAIVVLGLAVLVLFRSNLTVFSFLHNAVLIAWGLRLGLFLVARERKASFQKKKASVQQQYGKAPLPLRFVIWISVSVLYVLMFSPSLLNSARAVDTSFPALAWQGLGLLVMLAGLALEILADQQKSAAKLKAPDSFCDSGVYRWVRCPNYLGEIVFWSGSWIMGIPFYLSLLGWAAGLVGLICIVLIMVGSAKRLEGNQNKRYAQMESYQAYIRRVPILFPFLPIYTLQNTRIQIG
jgi:steroid 5-alpha reductase family enzyme